MGSADVPKFSCNCLWCKDSCSQVSEVNRTHLYADVGNPVYDDSTSDYTVFNSFFNYPYKFQVVQECEPAIGRVRTAAVPPLDTKAQAGVDARGAAVVLTGLSDGATPQVDIKPVLFKDNVDSLNKQTGGFRVKNNSGFYWISKLDGSKSMSMDSSIKYSDFINTHKLIFESGKPNFMGCRIPLYSNLNIPLWRSLLRDYEDDQLVELLEFGFPLGYNKKELPVSVIKNHSGAINFESSVDDYIRKELSVGVLAGPFSTNPLVLPLSISPLNTVPKKELGARRVISDLSFPSGKSVNDGIPKGVYLAEQIEFSFPTVDDLACRIREVGPPAMLFKKDLKRAYRQFRVDPGDAHLLGYFWKGSCYIDLALAMGVRSAAFLCQRVTSAISYIFTSMGYHLQNYIDDLGVCVPDSVAISAFNSLAKLLTALGIEEAQDKSQLPAKQMEFLGVLFDVNTMTMSVTPQRVNEILELVDWWLGKHKATKQQLQSLIGKLQFVAKCVRAGRIFISRLLLILPSLKRSHHRFYVNSQFKKDLIWWRTFLNHFNGVTIIPDMVWSAPDALLSTDACLSSLGGWSGKHYFSRLFPDYILAQDYHISILELYAIVIALKLWAPIVTNSRVQVYCDNSASVFVINTGRTKDKVMLALIREIAYLCATNNCQLRALHISGSNNRLADLMSRAPLSSNDNNKLNRALDNVWVKVSVVDDLFTLNNTW
jgi:hypothetical protein